MSWNDGGNNVPIPAFNEHGALPEGVHDCSLAELRERFGSFQLSDRRPSLYRQLDEFIRELRSLDQRLCLIVNGSFVTANPEPNDIDLLLVLPADWNFQADLSPNAYSLLSKTRVRRKWQFDILAAVEGTREYREYLEFFQRVRYRRGQRKGILQIKL